jgi:hypothetical protein
VAGEIIRAVIAGIGKGLTQSLLFAVAAVFFVVALLVLALLFYGFAEIKKGNKKVGMIIFASLAVAIIGVAFAGVEVLFVYGTFVLLVIFFKAVGFIAGRLLKKN